MTSKLQPDFLSNFFASLIKMEASKPSDEQMSRKEFQKVLTLELFNQYVSLISLLIYFSV